MGKRWRFLAIAWLIPLVATALGPFQSGDLAVWIAQGLASLKEGEILRKDIFSVLPTEPQVYPAWGASIVYGLIYQIGGMLAVAYLHVFVALLLFWIIYRNSLWRLSRYDSTLLRALLYLSWIGSLPIIGTRPNTLALIPLILFYLEVSLIHTIEDITTKRLLKLCFIATIWANVHGSFALAILMLGWKLGFFFLRSLATSSFSINESIRSLGSLGCIFLSTLINPFGVQIYPYILLTQQYSKERKMTEWMTTHLQSDFPLGLCFYILALSLVGLFIFHFRKKSFFEIVASPFTLLVILGFTAIRHAATPFIVLLPTVYAWGFLKNCENQTSPIQRTAETKVRKGLDLILITLLALMAFISMIPEFRPKISRLLPKRYEQVFDEHTLPKIAEKISSSGKTCSVFNSWEYGSYLMLATNNKIFIDTRNTIYSEKQFNDWRAAIFAQEGWQHYLDKYGACFAVIDQIRNRLFLQAALDSGVWFEIIRERDAVLLERMELKK